MWNLILIQILLNDTAFKNTFDHFLELGIFAVVTKYMEVEIALMGLPELSIFLG